jgi:hypothetical protein
MTGIPGTGALRVRFSHVNLTTAVDIKLITVVGSTIVAHPYPPFPGSTTIIHNTLSPYADTGVHEEAVLETLLTLSDKSIRDITTDPLTTYTFQDPGISGTPTNFSTLLTVTVTGNDAFVARKPDGGFGSVAITAR